MTKPICSLFVLAAVSLLPVGAQRLQPNFMQLSYISVPVEQRAAYEKFLKEDGVKLAQAASESGLIRGRTTLKLTQPFLNTEKYQYVLSMWYDKAPTMDEAAGAAWDAAAQKAGHESYAAYMAKSRSLGAQIVFAEMRRANLMVGSVSVGDFVRVASYHLELGDMGEYMRFVREVQMPIIKAQLNPDHVRAHLVSQRLLPNGTESDANVFRTVVTKTSADILANPTPMNETTFKKAHPDANYAAYVRDLAEWGKRAPLVRTRTWRVLAVAGKMPEPRATN